MPELPDVEVLKGYVDAFSLHRGHGKHLFVHIGEDGWLRLHFGMTGSLTR